MLDNKYGKQIQIILQSTLTNYTSMLAMIIFYVYHYYFKCKGKNISNKESIEFSM